MLRANLTVDLVESTSIITISQRVFIKVNLNKQESQVYLDGVLIRTVDACYNAKDPMTKLIFDTMTDSKTLEGFQS